MKFLWRTGAFLIFLFKEQALDGTTIKKSILRLHSHTLPRAYMTSYCHHISLIHRILFLHSSMIDPMNCSSRSVAFSECHVFWLCIMSLLVFKRLENSFAIQFSVSYLYFISWLKIICINLYSSRIAGQEMAMDYALKSGIMRK